MTDDAAEAMNGEPTSEVRVFADRRWAPSLAVLVIIVVPFLLPEHLRS